jgi:shikimate kinase
MSMKIVLIGFMGSGKTSVAKLLSNKLNLNLYETDSEILKRTGFQSIKELFESLGEKKFRELESEIAKELHNANNLVISPGGGMIINKDNCNHLRNLATTVYLKTSFEVLKKRVLDQTNNNLETRPLFYDEASAFRLFQKRLSAYENSCDCYVDTDTLTAEEVTNQIVRIVSKLQL